MKTIVCLLKFNSDETQLNRLFVSVFLSICILSLMHQCWSPPVVAGGLWVQESKWQSTSRVILMSVTQHYF